MKSVKFLIVVLAAFLFGMTSCKKESYNDFIPEELYGNWTSCDKDPKTGTELTYREDGTGKILNWKDGQMIEGWEFTYGYRDKDKAIRMKISGSYKYFFLTELTKERMKFYYIDSYAEIQYEEMRKESI